MSSEKLPDDEMLAAWEDWRKWCSVLRVRNPRPTQEEISRGLRDQIDPQTRERYYSALTGLIFRGLENAREKFKKVKFTDEECEELIRDFDACMHGKKKRISAEDAASFAEGGNYKDYIFYLAGKSDDPPLKVIHGKTVGPNGYLMDIIGRRLRSKKMIRGVAAAKISVVSLDARLDDAADDEFYNLVAATELDVMTQDAEELSSSLSTMEKVLLLAEAYHIGLETEVVYTATGLRKSALTERRKKLFEFIGAKYPDLTAEQLRLITFAIFEKLQTEKSALPFLNAIEEKDSRLASNRRTDYVED